MNAVGAFFKGARLARHMKPEEVALGMAEILKRPVSQSTVYKIEGNRMDAGLDLILALLRVLRADPRVMVAVSQDDDMSKSRAVELGRAAIRDDVAWLRDLLPDEQEQAAQFFEQG